VISFTPYGFPRPVGSTFRRRDIYAPQGLAPDEHAVLWNVSVVEVRGGTFIEAKTHMSPNAIVVDDLHGHSSLPPVLEAVKPLLDHRGGWDQARVPECVIVGCSNPCPMWSVGGQFANAGVECLTCQARSILACRECGAPELAHYVNREQLLDRQLCFTCSLWTDRFHDFGDSQAFVGDDWRYQTIATIGVGGGVQAMKGYGGRVWTIQFLLTGAIIKTDNLWDGGVVPEWFRDRLPQTAVYWVGDRA